MRAWGLCDVKVGGQPFEIIRYAAIRIVLARAHLSDLN
jgi:hypothetical protein